MYAIDGNGIDSFRQWKSFVIFPYILGGFLELYVSEIGCPTDSINRKLVTCNQLIGLDRNSTID